MKWRACCVPELTAKTRRKFEKAATISLAMVGSVDPGLREGELRNLRCAVMFEYMTGCSAWDKPIDAKRVKELAKTAYASGCGVFDSSDTQHFASTRAFLFTCSENNLGIKFES